MAVVTVDGKKLEMREDRPLLQSLREYDIGVPALCYHPALSPAGACKLCVVELLETNKPPQIKLSCILRPKPEMEIRTSTELVQRARSNAFHSLLKLAPESKTIRNLASEYGIDLGPAPDECIRCRLCIRACKEIVGANALTLEKRNGIPYVVPREDNPCIGCGTCANLCPTKAIAIQDMDDIRVISIRDEVISKNPLARCEACGRRFATQKFLARVDQKTEDHPHLKERHLYCPTCAKLFSTRIRSESHVKR